MSKRLLQILTVLGGLLGAVGPVHAELDQPYNYLTVQPYLSRQFNSFLGWRGQPVDLKDPKLIRYYDPVSRVPMMIVEFFPIGKKIVTEVANIKKSLADFGPDEKTELHWFLVYSTNSDITPGDVEKAFASEAKCDKYHTYKVYSQQGKYAERKTYYLTVHTDYKETFVRISLSGDPAAPMLGQCP